MDIIIGGDVVPTKSNFRLFNDQNIPELLGNKLNSIWCECDIRIFNLETPLTDKETPIDKCGPNLIAPSSTIKGIKALKPTLITLANNHILDQGICGLESTVNLLKENKIPFVGVGHNLYHATRPYIIEKSGVRIGIYACAEYEFSIADKNRPGANPFDPLESLDHIQSLKEKCDYVIVLYHGGKEHYRYPSPYLQRVCRKMAEKGADLIVCQHSHCIGSYESYHGSTIIYGQGNFIFNKYDNEYWNNSVLIKVIIDKGFKIEYIPIVRNENKVRLAEANEAEFILSEFYKRSNEIIQSGFIEKKYQSFAQNNINGYLRNFSGLGKWLLRVDRIVLKGWLIRKLFNKKKLLAIQNYIECEAHRELILNGIKGEIMIERKPSK